MFTLNCKGRLLVVDKPLVMGIINTTPDSFYQGSRFTGTDSLLHQAELMLKQGADIIDIGGQSTRPGSARITADEELQRVSGAIEVLHKNFPEAIISIDTYWSRVAEEAVLSGASIINDISAATVDEKILEVAARYQTPYCCMHMPGNPDTMHQVPAYENLMREILDYFIRKIELCRKAGIKDVIIDPGFGFGKTAAQNFELIRRLHIFKILQAPILVGVSRKSTIWKTLGITAGEALNGTTVLHAIALQNGASILRVHDVKEAVEAVKLVAEINNGQ
jgi:Dihydropteroate synthase (EC 2.5.1.15)